jgi:hypothetical protein
MYLKNKNYYAMTYITTTLLFDIDYESTHSRTQPLLVKKTDQFGPVKENMNPQ